MHMLMAVDMVRRKAQLTFEAYKLARNLGGDLVAVDAAREGSGQERAETRQPAVGGCLLYTSPSPRDRS